MTFRQPAMTFRPKSMETWEQHLSLTIVPGPFEKLAPLIAGVVRAREFAIGQTQGERMPPLMWLSEMQRRAQSGEKRSNDPPGFPIFSGTLIWSPTEAPDMTVVEHPLDGITGPEFSADLACVLPSAKLITFDSIMETARRQHHGLKIRQGKDVLRKAFTTIGFDEHRWEWHEEGTPEPFEDCALYQSRQIAARFNRPIMTRYIKGIGIDPDRSLSGRNFKASLHLWPLPDNEPAAAQFYCTDYDDQAAHARSCGVQKYTPSDLDDMFEEENFEQTAVDLKNMDHWSKTIQQARWKAGQSAERAKTPVGRLRAQWRVVDAVKQIQDEALAAGLAPHVARALANTGGLDAVMKELGEDTEAYEAYRACYTK